MARTRRTAMSRLVTRTAKALLTRLSAVERMTRIELAWPAWKESACPPEATRMRPAGLTWLHREAPSLALA